ncbi:hypothetical protein [uncultured Algibacter sp.]|uniref:hypothetical protein n=1 Tax=uncultured Algibacter sp. TaxID=298659 RepID=UPI0026385583|nr:hypothetical protein [uncultured Algibacter sp.]
MNTKFFSILITCLIVTSVFAQTSVNNYKYVIVPNKFDFLNKKDQYQINSLTEFLFKKHGFEALKEGSDYPKDLMINRCLALKTDVIKGSGMFKTKLTVELYDCNDKLVFTSSIGESREKEFKTAYNLALRDAFKSIEALNYKYVPNKNITSLTSTNSSQPNTAVTEEIQQLKKEIQNLKEEKQPEVAVVAKPQVETVQVATPQVNEVAVIQGNTNVLYAQAIDNGFQLVDSSPKVVYRIKNTNLKDVYIVEGKSAIIYKNNSDWVIEYYSGADLKQESLNIKF